MSDDLTPTDSTIDRDSGEGVDHETDSFASATASGDPVEVIEDLDDLDDIDFDLDEVENKIAPLALAESYAGSDRWVW